MSSRPYSYFMPGTAPGTQKINDTKTQAVFLWSRGQQTGRPLKYAVTNTSVLGPQRRGVFSVEEGCSEWELTV